MARNQSLKDPVQYLKNRIITNGISGENGTYLIGASVVVNPNAHAHSDTYDDAISFIKDRIDDDKDFARMVATLAIESTSSVFFNIPNYFGHYGCTLHFIRDGQTLSMVAILTEISISEFEDDVEILSHIALWFAKLANCETGKLRVIMTRAMLYWGQMEEENLLFNLERESN